MKTAKLLKTVYDGPQQKVQLFELNVPLSVQTPNDFTIKGEFNFVVVSAISSELTKKISYFAEAETLIFPANENGDVLQWDALEGSQKGIQNINKVLKDLDYTIIN